MVCPSCGTENPPEAQFCASCGVSLEGRTRGIGRVIYCTRCGNENAATVRSCTNCGSQLYSLTRAIYLGADAEYMGFWVRLAAQLVDGIILVVGLVVLSLLGSLEPF